MKIEILNFPLSFQLIGSIVHHPSGQKQQSFLLQDNIQRPSFLLETQGRETPFPALLLPEVGGGECQAEGRMFSIPSLSKEKLCLSSYKAWLTEDLFTDPQSPFKSPASSHLLLRAIIPREKAHVFSLPRTGPSSADPAKPSNTTSLQTQGQGQGPE